MSYNCEHSLLFLHASQLDNSLFVDLGKSCEVEEVCLLEPEYLLDKDFVEKNISEKTLLVFTSKHAVASVAQFLTFNNTNVAVVGEGTAKAVKNFGGVNVKVSAPGGVSQLSNLVQELAPGFSSICYFRGERVVRKLEIDSKFKIQSKISYRMKERELSDEERLKIVSFCHKSKPLFVVTSRQIVDCLQKTQLQSIFSSSSFNIRELRLIAFSKSIAEYAQKLGYVVCYAGSGVSFEKFVFEIGSYLEDIARR